MRLGILACGPGCRDVGRLLKVGRRRGIRLLLGKGGCGRSWRGGVTPGKGDGSGEPEDTGRSEKGHCV